MADKIQVAVRVRPVLLQKKDVEIHWSWSAGMVFQSEPGTQKRIGNPYLFDQVFGTETQNYQIFTKLVQPLIDSAMNGFNVTVLAYGQTASGKTYTMMGSQKELGIVQLAVDRIFTLIEQNPERAFLLRCSYIEIYNETISDLLSSTHQKLKVQELAEGNVVVHNLIETNVNTSDAVLKLMQQGNKQRKVGGTSMNERSSRSHTIFRIIVESVPRDEADRSDAAVIVSHINLVDLAGSEKASQTNATGDRFREGCAINTSLSALSLVIKQLSEGEGFVNFRDSKLTHILRASLGGNARTAIICNVTPTVLDETSSTLKFACSAKAVQNQPHVNEVLSDQALLRKYNNYIKDLERKLKEKELEKKPEAIEEMQRLLQEKDMKINELKEQLVVSSDVASGRPDCSLTAAQRSLRRMTWGGNRLKQGLNLLAPTIFEVNSPPVPCSEKVSRTVAQVFASRLRTSNTSQSEIALDEVAAENDSLDSETFFPAEMVFSKNFDPVAKVDVATMTDVKESPFKQPCTPSTPVPVLRERLQRMRMSLLNKEKENEDLKEELEDLTKFTRLEQEIGVHVQATAKNVASPESADHLHRALQTANDMEVLYLDTQRKLSELQTEFRTKETEHENEIHSMQTDYKQRLETEIAEKKQIAKELTDLRNKFDRLDRDHSEADTHIQVISERHAKREADLRETLQEAWAQLELLGQDPNAIKANSDAKQKLALVEQELLKMQKCNSDAQSQIASLTEELRQFKESALTVPEVVTKDDDRMLDNSLNGMCLADELRDVFMNQECSFVTRSVHRTRKRPSSILSVALAKMDQSACILDSTEQELEPSKKTRLSIQSDQSEELDISEVKEIREYLVELQSVLVRYEADYEVLSQEKELLNSQLINAQNEIANLREGGNKADPLARHRDEENSVKKLDTSEEMLDSSCFMGEQSISTSIMDMEQSCESDDQFLSLRDQFTDTRGSSISTEISQAAAQRIEKVEHSNQIKQLEEDLTQMSERLEILQQDVQEKSTALEQKQRSLEAAQSTVEVLEQRDEERQNLLLNLSELNEKINLLNEDSALVTRELETTRKTLKEIQAEAHALSVTKQLLESQLEKANEELDAVRAELEIRVAPPSESQMDQESVEKSEKILEDLSLALDRVKELESELEIKTAEAKVAQDAVQQACSSTDELKQASFEKIQLEDLVEKLTSQLDELQDDLELKTRELNEIQKVKQEIVLQKEFFFSELERKKLEVNEAQEELVEMRMKLESATTEVNTTKQDLHESCTRTQELVRLIEQLEMEKKDAVVSKEATEKELRIKSDSLEEAQKSMEEVHRSGSSEVNVLQDLLDKTRAETQQLQSANQELLSEIDVAKTKIKDLENDLTSTNATLCAINEETASKNQEYSAELNRKTQVIQQLEVSLKETSIHLTELQSTKEVVETELSELKQRIVDVEENLDSECRARAAVQRAAGEAASIAAAALQANVEEKEKIEQQLIEYREKAIKLSLELDHSTSALEAAKAEVIQLEKAARFERVPREDLDALSSELKDALLRVSQLEKSLEEKTAQLNLSYQKFEAAQARIRVLEQNEEVVSKQVQSFECTIQDLSAQNVNLDKMVAQFQSDLQSKEAELINFRSTNEKIALLESRLQEVNGDTAHMSRVIDGKTDEILRLQEELARVTGSQNDHQKQLQHAEQRFHDKQRELDEIRNSLQSMQSVNDDLVAKLSDKENLNVDLRKNLENSSQRFDLLHSKLESVQSEKSSLSERVRLLESQLECQEQEIGDLRRGLSDVHNERDLSTQLKHRLTSLQAQYDDAVSQCQHLRLVRDEILTHQEQSKEEILRLGSQLQVKIEEKAALEQYRIQSESQKEAILRDYQTVKNALTEKENQLHTVQCQRDEFINQVKILNEKIGEFQKKASASESSSKIQVQRNLEETVDKLKKELVAARSKSEILQLNFETEEDQRNKKIERLDKELETVKQQYAKCKEQLRLLRYRPNEEGTVSLPKPRVSIVVESISIQTDPIADKGFGFRWQMEQYVSDNERLRKKVSELGERMEFYKDKLIKYRNLYFQTTGQDPQRPSSSSSNHSSQPMERHSSSSSNCRENVADCPFGDSDRNPNKKTSLASAVPTSISPQPVALQETHQDEAKARISSGVAKPAMTTMASTRWSGGKKESLTKEEMEKINNCNPS